MKTYDELPQHFEVLLRGWLPDERLYELRIEADEAFPQEAMEVILKLVEEVTERRRRERENLVRQSLESMA